MNLVTQIALGRLAVGALALGRPADVSRLLKFGAPDGERAVYLTRLAGARDIALGVATLQAPRGARKSLVGLAMAVDASDAYAGYDAYRRGLVPTGTGLALVGPAVAAVLAGAAGLREQPVARDA